MTSANERIHAGHRRAAGQRARQGAGARPVRGRHQGRRACCTARCCAAPIRMRASSRIDTAAGAGAAGRQGGADRRRRAARDAWGVHHKERRILAEGVVRFAGEEVAAVAAVERGDRARRARPDPGRVRGTARDPDARGSAGRGRPPACIRAADNVVARDPLRARRRRRRLRVGATWCTRPPTPRTRSTPATWNRWPRSPRSSPTAGCGVDLDAVGARRRARGWRPRWSCRSRSIRVHPGDHRRRLRRQDGRGRQQPGRRRCWRCRTGRPVRVVNNRLEDFLAAPPSVPERITLKLGMDRDGLHRRQGRAHRRRLRRLQRPGGRGDARERHAQRQHAPQRQRALACHAGLHPHAAARRLPRLRRHADAVRAQQPHRHDGRAARPRSGRDPQAATRSAPARPRSMAGRSAAPACMECIDQATEAIGWQAKRARAQGHRRQAPRRRHGGGDARQRQPHHRQLGRLDRDRQGQRGRPRLHPQRRSRHGPGRA